MMCKRVLPVAVVCLGLLAGLTAARAAGPEDLFKGKIIITKKRLPLRFSSQGAFVAEIQKSKTDKICPTDEKDAEHGTWNLEYIAFFAQPLNDNEIHVKFCDITVVDRKYGAGGPPYTRE